MKKCSYYLFSSEYQLHPLSARYTVSFTLHHIIAVAFVVVSVIVISALAKNMNSQCGPK
jgi:hypothetical protein